MDLAAIESRLREVVKHEYLNATESMGSVVLVGDEEHVPVLLTVVRKLLDPDTILRALVEADHEPKTDEQWAQIRDRYRFGRDNAEQVAERLRVLVGVETTAPSTAGGES